MTAYHEDSRIRVPAVLAAAAIEAALAWLLVSGLAARVAQRVGERFEVISLPVQPSPRPTPSPSPRPSPDAGAPAETAGAAGRKAEATQIVAPKPRIVLPSPPPVVAAPVAGVGSQASAGAADAGEGPGAGGAGQGPGGGGAGGTGGGIGARRIAGGLRDSDYPEAAARVGAAGTVFIRIHVDRDGQVRGCEVTRSSGSDVLDATTCGLVTRRFRYRPALDSGGNPVDSVETTNFTWGPRDY